MIVRLKTAGAKKQESVTLYLGDGAKSIAMDIDDAGVGSVALDAAGRAVIFPNGKSKVPNGTAEKPKKKRRYRPRKYDWVGKDAELAKDILYSYTKIPIGPGGRRKLGAVKALAKKYGLRNNKEVNAIPQIRAHNKLMKRLAAVAPAS